MSRERDRKRTRGRKTADQIGPKITPVAALRILDEDLPVPVPIADASAFPRCAPRSVGPREGIAPEYNWADGLSED